MVLEFTIYTVQAAFSYAYDPQPKICNPQAFSRTLALRSCMTVNSSARQALHEDFQDGLELRATEVSAHGQPQFESVKQVLGISARGNISVFWGPCLLPEGFFLPGSTRTSPPLMLCR